MAVEYVKKLTGDNPLVDVIYENIEERLLSRLTVTGVTEVPRKLEYIVEEVTIKRFNMVGSEGLKSENFSGHSVTYRDDELFSEYNKEIYEYISDVTGTGRKLGVVYFI